MSPRNKKIAFAMVAEKREICCFFFTGSVNIILFDRHVFPMYRERNVIYAKAQNVVLISRSRQGLSYLAPRSSNGG